MVLPEEEVQEFPSEKPRKPTYIEELIEEVQVTEIVTKGGKPNKQVIKKHVIKKRKGDKQETIEIVTVEEEGKKPEATVTVKELELSEEEVEEFPSEKPRKPTYIEELTEEVQVTEIVTKEGKPKKQVIKKHVIKKRKGDKQETTEIVTVEEEGKNPETTVTVKELELPEET